jgi:hypothetical protein
VPKLVKQHPGRLPLLVVERAHKLERRRGLLALERDAARTTIEVGVDADHARERSAALRHRWRVL